MNELKFDRARFDAGEMPTRTRDGRKVLKVMDSGLDTEYPIVAWVEDVDGCMEYSRDGRFTIGVSNYPVDLVHEPKTRKVRTAFARSRYSDQVFAYTDDALIDYDRHIVTLRNEGRLLREIEVEA